MINQKNRQLFFSAGIRKNIYLCLIFCILFFNIMDGAFGACRFIRLKYPSFNNSSWFQLNEIEVYADTATQNNIMVPITSIISSQTPYNGFGVDKLKDGLKNYNSDFVIQSPVASDLTPLEITLDLGQVVTLRSLIHWNDGEYGALSVKVEISEDGNGYSLYADSSLTVTAGQPNSDTITDQPSIYTLSGYIKDSSEIPVSDTTIEISGFGNIYTNVSGFFHKTGLPPGDYILTPKSTTHTFAPLTKNITLPPDVTNIDFTATPIQSSYSIAGYVRTSAGAGVSSTAITISGIGTVLTDSDGRFFKSSLVPGTYTITPIKDNFTFNPSTRSITVGPEQTDLNFTAFQGSTANSVTGRFIKLKYLDFSNKLWFQLNEIEIYGIESGGLLLKLPFEDIISSRTPYSGFGLAKLHDGKIIYNGDFAVSTPGSLVEITVDLGSDKIIDNIVHWNDGEYGAKVVEIYSALSSSPNDFTFALRKENLTTASGQPNRDNIIFNQPIVINEVTLLPKVTIEYYNTSDAAVDITGWIADFKGIEYNFPRVSISAHGYVTLTEGNGDNTLQSIYAMKGFSYTEGESGYTSLKTSAGNGVDFMRWGTSIVPPPSGTTWSGVNPAVPSLLESLMREIDGTDTDTGDDWGVGSPTQGASNAVKYSIFGKVLYSSQALLGVNLNLSFKGNTQVQSDGTYGFTNISAGQYIVTPSKAGYIFDPPYTTVSVGPDAVNIDFTATLSEGVPGNFSFTGYIKKSDTTPVSAVELQISGATGVTTNTSGYYDSTSLPAGKYRVTPVSVNHIFTPEYLDITIGPSQAQRNFTAELSYSVSGYIRNSFQGPLSGVEVALNSSIKVFTDANGYFFKKSLDSGTYNITPKLAEYSFIPVSREVDIPPSAEQLIFDYDRKFLISGFVKDETDIPVEGCTVELKQGAVTKKIIKSDINGYYEFNNLEEAYYTIYCSKEDYNIAPDKYDITIGPSVTGKNFTGQEQYYLSGYLLTSAGQAVSGCSVEIEGVGTVLTNDQGYFNKKELYSGTYVVKPVKDFYLFTPQSRSITIGPSSSNNNYEGNFVPSGKLIYVDKKYQSADPDGSKLKPYPSITTAINSVSVGGASIEVAAGIYFEKIILKPNVTVRGAGPAVTIIDGTAKGSTVIMGDNSRIINITATNSNSGDTYSGIDCSQVNTYATAWIYNCIVKGNSLGIKVSGISPVIENTTIADNSVCDLKLVQRTSLEIKNSIIDLIVIDDSGSCLPQISYSCLLKDFDYFSENNNIGDDPVFIDREAGVYYLDQSSPCRDVGDPASEYNDIDGSRNDMGAFGGPRSGMTFSRLLPEKVESSLPEYIGMSAHNLIDQNIVVNGDFAVRNNSAEITLSFDLGTDRLVNRFIHYNDGAYGGYSVSISYSTADSPEDFKEGFFTSQLKHEAGIANRDILTIEPIKARYFKFTYEKFYHNVWFQLNEIEFYGWGGRPESEQIPVIFVESSKTPYPGYGIAKLTDGKTSVNNDFAYQSSTSGIDNFNLIFDLGMEKKVEKIQHYNDGAYGAQGVKLYYGHNTYPIEWELLGDYSGLGLVAGRANKDILSFSPITARYFKFEYYNFNNPIWFQLNEIEFWGLTEENSLTKLNSPTTSLESSEQAFPGFEVASLQDGEKSFNGDFAVNLGNTINEVVLTMTLSDDMNIENIVVFNDGQYGAKKIFIEYSSKGDPDYFISVGEWTGLSVNEDRINRESITFASLQGQILKFHFSDFNSTWFQLNEIEVYGGTIENTPANSAGLAVTDTIFSDIIVSEKMVPDVSVPDVLVPDVMASDVMASKNSLLSTDSPSISKSVYCKPVERDYFTILMNPCDFVKSQWFDSIKGSVYDPFALKINSPEKGMILIFRDRGNVLASGETIYECNLNGIGKCRIIDPIFLVDNKIIRTLQLKNKSRAKSTSEFYKSILSAGIMHSRDDYARWKALVPLIWFNLNINKYIIPVVVSEDFNPKGMELNEFRNRIKDCVEKFFEGYKIVDLPQLNENYIKSYSDTTISIDEAYHTLSKAALILDESISSQVLVSDNSIPVSKFIKRLRVYFQISRDPEYGVPFKNIAELHEEITEIGILCALNQSELIKEKLLLMQAFFSLLKAYENDM